MDHSNKRTRKFGRKPKTLDARDLQFADYKGGGLPAPPATLTWSGKLPATTANDLALGIMYNDVIGDCTCAGVGHCVQIWSSNVDTEVTVPDADILQLYETVGKYVPNKGNPPAIVSNKTDQGCQQRDVLKYWLANPIDDHKIIAYVAVDPKNIVHLKQAMQLFGCLYMGMLVPKFAMDANLKGLIWDLPAGKAPKSDDAHCVVLVDYDDVGPTCITWGMRQKMTWAFYNQYFDEAWAVLSQDWINSHGISPSNFNLAQLQSDLIDVKKAA